MSIKKFYSEEQQDFFTEANLPPESEEVQAPNITETGVSFFSHPIPLPDPAGFDRTNFSQSQGPVCPGAPKRPSRKRELSGELSESQLRRVRRKLFSDESSDESNGLHQQPRRPDDDNEPNSSPPTLSA